MTEEIITGEVLEITCSNCRKVSGYPLIELTVPCNSCGTELPLPLKILQDGQDRGKLHCLRCNHHWKPHFRGKSKNYLPTICPICKSHYWNKPKAEMVGKRKSKTRVVMKDRIEKAIQLHFDGKSPQEVADELDVHLSTVCSYYKRRGIKGYRYKEYR